MTEDHSAWHNAQWREIAGPGTTRNAGGLPRLAQRGIAGGKMSVAAARAASAVQVMGL